MEKNAVVEVADCKEFVGDELVDIAVDIDIAVEVEVEVCSVVSLGIIMVGFVIFFLFLSLSLSLSLLLFIFVYLLGDPVEFAYFLALLDKVGTGGDIGSTSPSLESLSEPVVCDYSSIAATEKSTLR